MGNYSQQKSSIHNSKRRKFWLWPICTLAIGLRAEAMQTLLDAVAHGKSQTGADIGALYAMLERLAWEMRLLHDAENYYTQASQVIGGTQNIESQATIQDRLGRVYKELQDVAKAKVWFERAQESYQQLGDKPYLDEITRHLERLRME